jgi:DUF4097 and DUF4098 domain-containing protein YvlB
MPEYEEKTHSDNNSEQVISIDPNRLRFVKIVGLDSNIRVKGTSEPVIRVRSINQDGANFPPQIELASDGRSVEISARPGKEFKFRFDTNWKEGEDPDVAQGWYGGDYDSGGNPGDWGFRDRAEHERKRDEARRERHEWRERVRQEKRQAGWEWGNFEVDTDVFTGIGDFINKTMQSVFGRPTEIFVEIPSHVELEVKNVSGSIEVSDMSGYCNLKSTSGQFTLRNLNGEVQLKGMSGKLEAYRLTGGITAKMTSSSINLLDCRLKAMELSSTSGNIFVETAVAEASESDFRINNVSGSVRLMLKRNTRATIESRTLSGKIQIQPEIGWIVNKNRPGQSQSKVDMNGGGRKIMINTVSGKIDVGIYDQPGVPIPPTPPQPPQQNWPPIPPVPPMPPFARTEFIPKAEQKSESDSGNASAKWPAATPGVQVEEGLGNAKTDSPAPKAAKKFSQLEILQAIERGEMTVEEGMARLAELENN